ncbi:serine/threonine-protein kinase [Marinobacter sp. C2H3]|uniref:serine/threonine-protein kinase n=1 Tax=Marinobacter sp. C2H3 TaxID=3119003 RepID=UPI00300F7360
MSGLLSSMFSLRALVLALAAVFAVAADQIPMVSWLDRVLLNTLGVADASGLVPVPLPQVAEVLAQRGLMVPDWSGLALQLSLALAATYLMFGVPRLGAAVALPVTLLLAGALLVTQGALMFYRSLWLPLGQVMTLLGVGYVILLFWLQPHRRIVALIDNVRDARLRLAHLLLGQGQTDEALQVLDDLPAAVMSRPEALELRYQIALQQERRRQYEQALTTYNGIRALKRQYRDVVDRIAALGSNGPVAMPRSGAADLTQTLVVEAPSVSRPVLGRYEIVRELGRGAMGVVYLATDPKIARTVAVKTLPYAALDQDQLSALKARFFREAEAAGRLSHPAIVTIYDVGEEPDLAYMAMDYAPGRPLSEFARPGRLLPVATVLDVLAEVAEALAYAHERRIVHRDIKPSNILYDAESGSVKVTDFGIARVADDSMTRTGSVMGSPLYMSPEQLMGQKVTGASDIYSLGATLFKLVTGETPFQGDTLAGLTYQILNKRPRSARSLNADLPAGVVRVIGKAIQREPGKRFGSAAEMAEALRRAAARELREAAS